MRLYPFAVAVTGVALLGLPGGQLAGQTQLSGTSGAKDHHSDDALPAGALARLGSERLRHGRQVVSLAFSRDGTNLVSAALDGPPRLWDARSVSTVRFLSRPSPRA